jgi:hypothetical protein
VVGGYIFVGVKDKMWEQVGLAEPFRHDTKLLRDKILRATGLTLDVDVVPYTLTDPANDKRFALILVRSSRKRTKRRSPTLVAEDFCAGTAFRRSVVLSGPDSTGKR